MPQICRKNSHLFLILFFLASKQYSSCYSMIHLFKYYERGGKHSRIKYFQDERLLNTILEKS